MIFELTAEQKMVQEQAKRFANRPLPMAESERATFEATIGLWDEMRLGYARCLDAALNKDAGMRAQAALPRRS